MSLKQAIVLGSLFEFLGAITMGQTVAQTISKGVLDPTQYKEDGCRGTFEFALGMFCVLVGAGVTTMFATWKGLPISATHSIVGGLIAVGLIGTQGINALNVDEIIQTMIAWVASPLVGAVTAALYHVFISTLIFGSDNPGKVEHSLASSIVPTG